MKRLPRVYRLLFILQLLFAVYSGVHAATPANSAFAADSTKVYVIQVAASKVFLEPADIRQSLGITSEVRYFQKDGWFKYYTGTYRTESGAANALAAFKFAAFVATLPVNDSVVRKNVPVSKDTIAIKSVSKADTVRHLADSVLAPITDSDMKRLYNLKIREADSAFNILKDLILAKKLYEAASVIEPDKHYPADQVVEINQQLAEKSPGSFMRKLPLKVFIGVCGTLLLIVIAAIVAVFVRRRIKKKDPELELLDQWNLELAELFAGQLPVILEKFPLLAGRLVEKSDVGLVGKEIEQFLNSADIDLREQAQIVYMLLNPKDPLVFLEKLDMPFTDREQLQVLEAIREYQIRVPDFSRWLRSLNESVIVFAVRMMRVFRQHDSFRSLLRFLQHSNPEIREEIIQALGEIRDREVMTALLGRFEEETRSCRLQIIKAISRISDDSGIAFLKKVATTDPDLRIEALCLLVQCGGTGLRFVNDMPGLTDYDLQLVSHRILEIKTKGKSAG